ncbi:pyridoxamine 5'-phosphate oxidase family protein [Staphylococcus pseudintermedius]|uniref:pyridoxamine 5'-phosphate oxidase family protein n=1 Tax=Staphylococcus pseudintermedius TaxID=283734 RepID=UPI0028FD3C56|nr:pyridoxamine 5'-phosphate oxidase family protein [Staphylococcus pseudintermedius]MDU0383278.1 pyridoxamine 5'-phosphate oxidase family protein [Staphylococcus pseudintermedius]
MMKQQAIEKINQVIEQSRIGVLSTAVNNKPNSRYMIFYNDDLDLYTKTSRSTRKFEELTQNPVAHVLLGYEESSGQPYVEIEGRVDIITNSKEIDWLWQEQDHTFFDSKNDPDLVVLRIIPSHITLLNSDETATPFEIDVSQL